VGVPKITLQTSKQTLTELQNLNGGKEEERFEKMKKLNRKPQSSISRHLDLIQQFWTESALFSSITGFQDLQSFSINICIFLIIFACHILLLKKKSGGILRYH
jgi:hypothetical protein